MFIKHNIHAINANRQYGIVAKKRSKTIEKLSSGYRVNRSADDASGLSISEKMRRQIRGLSQASMNCQDGISMVQIADGALNEIHDMLHRGTELSVRAANGTLSQQDREYIQREITQLKEEIDGIASRTTFNEFQVLKGNNSQVVTTEVPVEIRGGLPDYITNASSDLQAGYLTGTYNNGEEEYIAGRVDFSMINAGNIGDLDGCGFNMTCATCSNRYSIEFTSDAQSSMTTSGSHYIYKISTDGVTDGSELIDRIIAGTQGGHPNNHYTQFTKSDDGNSMIIYDNRSSLASSNPEYYQQKSKMQPGIAYAIGDEETEEKSDVYIQAGAEAGQHIDIKLPEISSSILGISSVNVVPGGSAADSAIMSFKNALSYVSAERARMGSYQIRMEHTINNLNNVVENTTSAEAAIRDADMAKETMYYAQMDLLAQAGQAMLAQTNQSQQGVLSLLQ